MVVAGIAAPWITRAASGAGVAGGPPIALEAFFKAPQMSTIRLAPGGKHICGIREINGRRNLVVIDVGTHKALTITNYRDDDVSTFWWVNADRLLYQLTDKTRGVGYLLPSGLLVVDRDGNNGHAISGVDDPRLLPQGAEFVGRVIEGGKPTSDILVQIDSIQTLGKFSSNLYRVDTATASKTLLTLGAPHDVRAWVCDRQNVVRAAVSTSEAITRVHFRASANDPWRVIFEFGPEAITSQVLPLAFDVAGRLYVSANAGADTSAIYRFDAERSALESEPVVAINGFDLTGGLRFNADASELLGVDYEADRTGTQWFHPKARALQAAIDHALPATVNHLSFESVEDLSTVLVESHSDVDPGSHYLFNDKEKVIEKIAVARPWIQPQAMRPTTFFRYPARDGLSIPAQLTLPSGSGPFPLVVLHYGGPWVRPIHHGWDPHVQFLASRGYAVFMPAPRASTGFGARLYRAGWKQWGLAMQDDVTDGVLALIKQGKVDSKRVAIAGASYGGYLTMMGLAKEPQLFRCGVNWVGVTDPSFMFSVTWTDFNRVDAGRYSLPLLIGDPVKDAEQFKRTSPVERAAEIKQPVLMAYGGSDTRVPIVNGERMLAALKPSNSHVEWVVYKDEGHGWRKLETNIDFWTRVEKFLATSLA